MKAVIDGLRYDTKTATLIADDEWWDGSNWEREGRNTYLYRTPRGRYFFRHYTCWQGEANCLEACSQAEAIDFYESAQGHPDCIYMPFEEAFPGAKIEDA